MDSKNAKGWECPKCGDVYAPWVDRCGRCSAADKAVDTVQNTVEIIWPHVDSKTDGSAIASDGVVIVNDILSKIVKRGSIT